MNIKKSRVLLRKQKRELVSMVIELQPIKEQYEYLIQRVVILQSEVNKLTDDNYMFRNIIKKLTK